MKHICHALGCKANCQPKYLMCPMHWRMVPRDMQIEVYRTVKIRDKRINATWAPWWRAQAHAIGFVANSEHSNPARYTKYMTRELDFADTLEAKK